MNDKERQKRVSEVESIVSEIEGEVRYEVVSEVRRKS